MEHFVSFVVGLPDPLKAAIALGVLALVRLLLAGRVPDEFVTEIAAAITTAVVTIIELLLGLIPSQFDLIVAAILQLIVVLLGGVLVVRAYLIARHTAIRNGIRF